MADRQRGEMSKRKKPQTIEYAFRFAKGSNTEQTRMVEMIRVNLAELVKMVEFTYGGQEVPVDGFRLRDDPEVVYTLDQPIPHLKGEQR
ncbi:MAG: hypothetical protein V3S24_10090 [Candidatus Tectomicrobia bacterium]|jgi:hypothetical protein